MVRQGMDGLLQRYGTTTERVKKYPLTYICACGRPPQAKIYPMFAIHILVTILVHLSQSLQELEHFL